MALHLLARRVAFEPSATPLQVQDRRAEAARATTTLESRLMGDRAHLAARFQASGIDSAELLA